MLTGVRGQQQRTVRLDDGIACFGLLAQPAQLRLTLRLHLQTLLQLRLCSLIQRRECVGSLPQLLLGEREVLHSELAQFRARDEILVSVARVMACRSA